MADGYPICIRCSSTLAETLRGAPELVDDLLVTLSKQDRLASGAGRGGRTEQPLPVRLDIPDEIWSLGNTLTTWVRELAEINGWTIDTRHLARPIRGNALDAAMSASNRHDQRCQLSDLPPSMCAHCRGDQLPAEVEPDYQVTVLRPPVAPVLGWRPPTALDSLRFAAGWLAEHIGHLRRLPAAEQAHDELTDAMTAANKACSAPPLRVFVGACEKCEADLYGWPDHRAVRCGRCGTEYRDMADRWDAALLKLRGYPATAATIARFTGELYGVQVNRKAINLWHHRRKITAIDHDDHDDPRFRIGDVLALARQSVGALSRIGS
ncbi:MAG: hypothetical protein ACREN2_13500 [Candidatus Dormibacteria bacterium]